MTTKLPPAPTGLANPGRKLWRATLAEFEPDDRELAILEEACRVRDTIAALRARLDLDGLMLTSSQGMRLHPAVAEVRQQQLALARLLATLRVPGVDDDELPASSGVRGVYSITRSA